MGIQFKFNLEKTVEAVALLLKLHGGTMRYLALLKMLYMADRIALERIEQPISGDIYVSMKFGPVLSRVYDLIKGKEVGGAINFWSKHISSRPENYSSSGYDYTIKLLDDPSDDELSEEEIEILNEVYRKYGGVDRFDLAEITHLFPEWKKPSGNIRALPITFEDVFYSLGKSEEEIEQISEEVKREEYLDWFVDGQ